MKKLLFLILIPFFSSLSYGQTSDCEKSSDLILLANDYKEKQSYQDAVKKYLLAALYCKDRLKFCQEKIIKIIDILPNSKDNILIFQKQDSLATLFEEYLIVFIRYIQDTKQMDRLLYWTSNSSVSREINTGVLSFFNSPTTFDDIENSKKASIYIKQGDSLRNIGLHSKALTKYQAAYIIHPQYALKGIGRISDMVAPLDKKISETDKEKLTRLSEKNIFYQYLNLSFSYHTFNSIPIENLTIYFMLNNSKIFDALLLQLLNTSLAIKEEKVNEKAWQNLIPLMNNEQKTQLFQILGTESSKLNEMDLKYQEKLLLIKHKYLKRWAFMEYLKNPDSTLQSAKNIKDLSKIKYVADTLIDMKKYKEAIRIYEICYEINPNNLTYLGNMGLCYYNIKQFQKTIDVLKKYLKLKPNYLWALKLLTRTYSEIKDYKNAYIYAKNIAEEYNNWYDLSFYALFVGKPQEAIEAAQKSLSLAPDENGVITNLVLGYLLNNQWDKAEPLYKEWKNKSFKDDKRLAKEVFLADIDDLEKAGITHKDFEKVKKMMQE